MRTSSWLFWGKLAIYLVCINACSDSLTADDLRKVELKSMEGTLFPFGEIDLGNIKGDEPIEIKFLLANFTDRELLIEGVRSTCSCTNVELPQVKIVAGQVAADPGMIRIKSVKGRGNVIVGQVALLNNFSRDPVGIISIKAIVERPFAVEKTHYDQVLDEDIVEFAIPLDVDPSIAVGSLKCSEAAGLLEVSVIRKAPNGRECSVLFRGNREALLREKVATVSITFSSGRNSVYSDSVQFSFRDGKLLRIIPRVVGVIDGHITFTIFKQSKIAEDGLTVATETGEELKTELVRRSPSLFVAKVQLPKDFKGKRLRVSDGSCDVWVVLEAEL